MASLRRGLPRVRGGEPWPSADAVAAVQDTTAIVVDVDQATEADDVIVAARADTVITDTMITDTVIADAGAPEAAVTDVVAETAAVPAAAPTAVLRRGLPRVRGGEPWPDAVAPEPLIASAPAVVQAAAVAETVVSQPVVSDAAVSATAVSATAASETAVANPVAVPAGDEPASTLRRGLPRVSGGEPWPSAGAVAPRHTGAAEPAPVIATATADAPAAVAPAAVLAAAAAPTHEPAPTQDASTGTALRRGLPRHSGGDPWPPDGVVQPRAQAAAPAASPSAPPVATPGADVAVTAAPAPVDAAAAPAAVAQSRDVTKPLPFVRTVWVGASAARTAEDTGPRQIGPLNTWQWFLSVIFGGPVLLILLLLVVTAVRAVLAMDGPASFIRTYPGSYELPDWSQPGFPAWVQWQHFFNFFLMASIIKTGLQVRQQKKPPAFWSPRGNPKRKISIALWLHQSLDILWVANGVIFIVLLFVSGHWVRIVPTSWEVFPNALSAGLQYVSLDWPTEHGWANYNSLQQLAYFTTVFIAAPLAVITGVRMSGFWPKDAKALNRLYPVEWARAVHFPVMLYFVLFIIGHVTLVFATGALRNLNHMFGGSDELNWTGFWIFGVSLIVTVIGVWAARPLVVAPIAKLFGKVSAR